MKRSDEYDSSGEATGTVLDEREELDRKADVLVTRFQAGDRSAMDELYLHYRDPLHHFLSTILRDHHEAEDLVQQVFVEAIQSLPRFEVRSDMPVRAWLYRVARNKAIDAIRLRARFVLEDPARIDARRERIQGEAVDSPLASLSDQDVTFFLRRLPPAQREVVSLHDLLGFSFAEVAKIMNKSVSAVYDLHHRGLRALELRLTAFRDRAERGQPRRAPALTRVKRAPVLRARLWALGGTSRADAMVRASARWRF